MTLASCQQWQLRTVAGMVLLWCVFVPTTRAVGDCTRPAVGAIRWDAWNGQENSVGKAVQSSLGRAQWQDRWPWFAAKQLPFAADESQPTVVRRENVLAHEAGLAFWAFVFYGSSSPLDRALDRYLIERDDGMAFALILGSRDLIGDAREPLRQEVCGLVHNPRYFRDAAGRRPVFVLMAADDAARLPAIDAALRGACVGAGADPRHSAGEGGAVAVAMVGIPSLIQAAATRFGGPVAAYAYEPNQKAGTFQDLASAVEQLWTRQLAAAAFGVIPLIMTGWDPRPRLERPVGWISYVPGVYYAPPTPSELSAHVRAAVSFAREHPAGGCAALIYAWNEFDEGGWLAPTVGDGNWRLAAIKSGLDR